MCRTKVGSRSLRKPASSEPARQPRATSFSAAVSTTDEHAICDLGKVSVRLRIKRGDLLLDSGSPRRPHRRFNLDTRPHPFALGFGAIRQLVFGVVPLIHTDAVGLVTRIELKARDQ